MRKWVLAVWLAVAGCALASGIAAQVDPGTVTTQGDRPKLGGGLD